MDHGPHSAEDENVFEMQTRGVVYCMKAFVARVGVRGQTSHVTVTGECFKMPSEDGKLCS